MALNGITKLVDARREKGYLTYKEVNDLIPHDIHSPEDLDDLLAAIGTQVVDVLEGQPRPASSALDKQFKNEGEVGEDVELDQTPGPLETIKDPTRIYLREMGVAPLLTREVEVDIAKRIERGQLRVLKALSRSPIVIRQIAAIGEDLPSRTVLRLLHSRRCNQRGQNERSGVGEQTSNRNPENYFTEVEQAAFESRNALCRANGEVCFANWLIPWLNRLSRFAYYLFLVPFDIPNFLL